METKDKEPNEVQKRDCGCVVRIYDDRQGYDPCLIHALDHAGRMLSAAAARLEEQSYAQSKRKKKGPKLVVAQDMPGDHAS